MALREAAQALLALVWVLVRPAALEAALPKYPSGVARGAQPWMATSAAPPGPAEKPRSCSKSTAKAAVSQPAETPRPGSRSTAKAAVPASQRRRDEALPPRSLLSQVAAPQERAPEAAARPAQGLPRAWAAAVLSLSQAAGRLPRLAAHYRRGAR
jgi:hypothetical protein